MLEHGGVFADEPLDVLTLSYDERPPRRLREEVGELPVREADRLSSAQMFEGVPRGRAVRARPRRTARIDPVGVRGASGRRSRLVRGGATRCREGAADERRRQHTQPARQPQPQPHAAVPQRLPSLEHPGSSR
ncbi:MAG TPA: hypothetical protein VF549_21625 [Solirubrobacteraceae bacterium]